MDDAAATHREERPDGMVARVALLSASFCFGIAAAFSQISTTAIVAGELNGQQTSTVPLGVILAGGALSAAWVPQLVRVHGPRKVYLVGATAGALGSLTQFLALQLTSEDKLTFALLVLGAVPQGFSYACTNGYRLAAVRVSTPGFAPKAIAMVVGGGVLAPLIGPELAKSSSTWLDRRFAGTFLQLVVLYCLQFGTLWLNSFAEPPSRAKEAEEGSASAASAATRANEKPSVWTRKPELFLAVLLQAVSYATMGGLMAATPLAMTDEGFSFKESTTAITLHMLGMFVPSFVSGRVVAALGAELTAVAGFSVLLGGGLLFLASRSLGVFIASITLVGVGWNFSFVAATTQLTALYRPEERHLVHSINDMLVIGLLAVALLTTGVLYWALGWLAFVGMYCGIIGVLGLLPSTLAALKSTAAARAAPTATARTKPAQSGSAEAHAQHSTNDDLARV